MFLYKINILNSAKEALVSLAGEEWLLKGLEISIDMIVSPIAPPHTNSSKEMNLGKKYRNFKGISKSQDIFGSGKTVLKCCFPLHMHLR